jgi:hypothetical protein
MTIYELNFWKVNLFKPYSFLIKLSEKIEYYFLGNILLQVLENISLYQALYQVYQASQVIYIASQCFSRFSCCNLHIFKCLSGKI